MIASKVIITTQKNIFELIHFSRSYTQLKSHGSAWECPVLLLRELRNYNRKLILCPPQKIGGNTTNILNCYFSK